MSPKNEKRIFAFCLAAIGAAMFLLAIAGAVICSDVPKKGTIEYQSPK